MGRHLTTSFMFLVVLIAVSLAVNAQTGSTRASVANVDFGSIARGGSAERDVILTNPSNSTITYSVNFVNVSNVSGRLSAAPTNGSIAPKSNVTVVVRLDVPSKAKEGNFSSGMVVNESAQGLRGLTILPAVVAHVTYTVQGYASIQAALSDIDMPLVIGVLSIFAVIAIGTVYFILKRK